MKTFKLIPIALILVFVSSCTSKKEDLTNTLRTYSIAKIKGLDPIQAGDVYAGMEVGRVYEGLVQYHYLKRPFELVPNLLSEMPSFSKDKKTLTFKLKKGVLFQDDACFLNGKGRELVAEDVIYSWKRLADPKNNSENFWIFDGRIEGLNEWQKEMSKAGKTDYSVSVKGLKAIDTHTLQVTLTKPSFQFLYYLAMPAASIVPKEAVDHYGDQFLNHAVGTGPFTLKEYNPASKLVWVKNPTYRKELYPSEGAPGDAEKGLLADAGKALPLVDKVIVQIFEESQPQWLTFMKGELDHSGIPKDNFGSAVNTDGSLKKELADKGITLTKSSGLDITYTSFNMDNALIGKNKYLRQAISHAYNMDKAIELFYNGRAINAQSPIPPGLSGYEESFKNPYKVYDLAKAKELMKKAGYGEGKTVELDYLTLADSTSRQWTEFRQKELSEIGVKLNVQTFSWPEFIRAKKDNKGQIWSMAWNGDYPDAENFLQLFYSKNKSPGPNDSRFSNSEFDRLYDKSLTLPEGAERTALYKKMKEIVVEESPWIPETHRIAYSLTHPWLKNVKPNDFDHSKAKYYRVDRGNQK